MLAGDDAQRVHSIRNRFDENDVVRKIFPREARNRRSQPPSESERVAFRHLPKKPPGWAPGATGQHPFAARPLGAEGTKSRDS